MKFGVVLPTYGPDAGRMAIIDAALAAEDAGFDSIWVTDHLALPVEDAERFTPIYEAISTLSFLAGSTSRIRLGISALVLPQRNAIEVGKSLATLDNLSGGRVILAAAIGWSAGEFSNLGYLFSDRVKRTEESIKVLRTLWRGRPTANFRGEYYHFQRLTFQPGPVQSGGPVLWVAGNAAASLRRAVSLGDGWHPNLRSADTLRQELDSVRPMLMGRPFTVSMRMPVGDGEILTHSTAQIVDQLKIYAAAGLEYPVLHFKGPAHSREIAIRKFAREVIPILR